MKLLINYANILFAKSQKFNSKTGIEIGGFDKTISYSPKDIDKDFYRKNKKILKKHRGGGYWLWKPYFIKKSLELLNEGDFLFYCDSGAHFISSITPIIEISLQTGQAIIPFRLGEKYIEKTYTKRDAFILMGCDEPKYTDSQQHHASYHLWRKSKFAMDFIDEFLYYAQDERIITDIPNQCEKPNYPGFKYNRHDQSVFSLLTKKHGLVAYEQLSSNNESYRRIIRHHRGELYSISWWSNKILKIIYAIFRKFCRLFYF